MESNWNLNACTIKHGIVTIDPHPREIINKAATYIIKFDPNITVSSFISSINMSIDKLKPIDLHEGREKLVIEFNLNYKSIGQIISKSYELKISFEEDGIRYSDQRYIQNPNETYDYFITYPNDFSDVFDAKNNLLTLVFHKSYHTLEILFNGTRIFELYVTNDINMDTIWYSFSTRNLRRKITLNVTEQICIKTE